MTFQWPTRWVPSFAGHTPASVLELKPRASSSQVSKFANSGKCVFQLTLLTSRVQVCQACAQACECVARAGALLTRQACAQARRLFRSSKLPRPEQQLQRRACSCECCQGLLKSAVREQRQLPNSGIPGAGLARARVHACMLT